MIFLYGRFTALQFPEMSRQAPQIHRNGAYLPRGCIPRSVTLKSILEITPSFSISHFAGIGLGIPMLLPVVLEPARIGSWNQRTLKMLPGALTPSKFIESRYLPAGFQLVHQRIHLTPRFIPGCHCAWQCLPAFPFCDMNFAVIRHFEHKKPDDLSLDTHPRLQIELPHQLLGVSTIGGMRLPEARSQRSYTHMSLIQCPSVRSNGKGAQRRHDEPLHFGCELE